MRIVVFEDTHVAQLYPMTLGRAAYTIRCGGENLAFWIERMGGQVSGLVRPYLRAWQAATFPNWDEHPPRGEATLLVNARLVPSPHTFDVLRRLYHRGDFGQLQSMNQLAAAVLPAEILPPTAPWDGESMRQFVQGPNFAALPRFEEDLALISYPHEILSWHLATLADSLNFRIAQGHYRELRDGVFVAHGVQWHEWVHTDTSQGPIVVDEQASVRPFACLSGPILIGAQSRVHEHASIRPGVALGPACKIGGEIEASVLEEFANKQHFGFLGHSYLGAWVNLGAGTSNSNLKNTYGSVRVEMEGRKMDSGLQLLGCLVGDYTKTAIHTSIFTGKILGACSMIYGMVTTNVASFVNHAQSLGQITDLPPAIVAETQRRVFQRRGIAQEPWHIQLLRDMYQQVAGDRQLADRPLSL